MHFFQFKHLSWFEHFNYFNQLSWIVQFVSLTVFAESRLGMTLARNLPKTDGGNGVPLWLSQDCLFPRSYNWTMIALLKSWGRTSLLQKDENISYRFWVTILLPAFHIYAGMASAPGARCLAFFWDALEFTIAGNKDFHFDTDVALTW